MKPSGITQIKILLYVLLLFFYSCAKENLDDNVAIEEFKLLSNKAISFKKPPDTNDCENKIVGESDEKYNCFGFAFSVSENGVKNVIDNQKAYEIYIKSGLFKETNQKATKVLYWANKDDFDDKDYHGINHAAIILAGDRVRSKKGTNYLYEHCITYNYVSLEENGSSDGEGEVDFKPWPFYRTYALDINLKSSKTELIKGDTFTIKTPADGGFMGVTYSWEFNSDYFSMVSQKGLYSATFLVTENAEGSQKISLHATHQNGETGYAKEVFKKAYTESITLKINPHEEPNLNEEPPLIARLIGSNYLTSSSLYIWKAYVDGGNPPYQYSWWLKRIDGTGGAAYQVGTGSQLDLVISSIGKSKLVYYELQLKVLDSSNPVPSFTTTSRVIVSKGLLKSAL
jgi:hypothetical protein